MSSSSSSNNDKKTLTVLVTGANGGLGQAACCRLIDEFLHTRPASSSIHILFSTRDHKKRLLTLKAINKHVKNILKEVTPSAGADIDTYSGPRITIQGVLVDLTKLLTVKALAEQLLRKGQHIDAVLCNAGIGGWNGLHWGQAIYDLCFNFMQATTFPTFQSCNIGAITKPQLTKSGKDDEPVLGEVFTANVFGHYMLVHWLSPLLDAQSRIVWVSSLSAQPSYFTPDDFQRLRASEAYESSKRITDLMVLTSDQPASKRYVDSFFPTKSQPVMYVTQPGVVFTGINGLPAYLAIFILAAFWIARWLGSPWHTIETYPGAVSAVWTCLAPDEQLRDRERKDGKAKWGSVVTVHGDEGVMRSEIEGWAFNGRIGPAPAGSVAGKHGRWAGRTRLTEEKLAKFKEDGALVWRELESLRQAWEGRLGALEI